MCGSEIDIIHQNAFRSYRTREPSQILSYTGTRPDHIVLYMGFDEGKRRKVDKAVQCICVVEWSPNVTVLFAEFSEAEPSAHIHSLSTSDAEEGCSGDEDEAAKGLYSCDSNIWDAGPYDPPMSICTKVMSKGDHNIMFSVTPDMWMTYNSPESFTWPWSELHPLPIIILKSWY